MRAGEREGAVTKPGSSSWGSSSKHHKLQRSSVMGEAASSALSLWPRSGTVAQCDAGSRYHVWRPIQTFTGRSLGIRRTVLDSVVEQYAEWPSCLVLPLPQLPVHITDPWLQLPAAQIHQQLTFSRIELGWVLRSRV